MWKEPQKPDPADIARKLELAPDLKVVPGPTWELSEDGESLVAYKMQDISVLRKVRNRIATLLYNMLITYIPSHTVRLGFLRLVGARIGKGSSIMRGKAPQCVRQSRSFNFRRRCSDALRRTSSRSVRRRRRTSII